MTTTSPIPSNTRRRRQLYSAEFKAQAVAACLQPGVSIAAIALANQLNANVLRRWVKQHEAQQLAGRVAPAMPARPPAVVPVAVQPEAPTAGGEIRCEIRHRQSLIQVTWPADQAAACAQWLRELMQ
jgi:transposase-like protein